MPQQRIMLSNALRKTNQGPLDRNRVRGRIGHRICDLSISLAQHQQFSPLGMDKADSQHNRGLRVSDFMVSTFLAKLRFLDCGRVAPFVPPPPLGFPYPAHSFLASGLLCSANKPN